MASAAQQEDTQEILFGMRQADERPLYRKALAGTKNFALRYPMGMVGAVIMVLLVAMAIVPALFTPLSVQKLTQSLVYILVTDSNRQVHNGGLEQMH